VSTGRQVVLYVRAGCHLCAEARTVVAAAAPAFVEVDVDDDPALVRRYGEAVPVVTVDGRQVGFWRIDPVRLRAALEA
jgi:glutaredoxin